MREALDGSIDMDTVWQQHKPGKSGMTALGQAAAEAHEG